MDKHESKIPPIKMPILVKEAQKKEDNIKKTFKNLSTLE